MSPNGLDDFNKRVKRIRSPRNNSYYDPDLGMHVPKKVSNEVIRRNAKEKKSWFKGIFWSLVIGALGLMVGQAVRFRYFGLSEPDNVTLFTDLLLALLFVLTMSAGFRYRRMRYRVAQVLGAGAILVAGHNLILYYPDHLALIYSDEYVQIIRETTEPGSLIIPVVAINL